LIRSDYEGNWSVFLPTRDAMEQMAFGPDGDVYTAGEDGVDRMDPTDGSFRPFLEWESRDTPRALDWSPDGSKVYIGTISESEEPSSPLYVVDLDEEGVALGPPRVHSPAVGGGWHDGVAVDACGYIYVPEFWDSLLLRVDPQGNSIIYYDWNEDCTGDQYGHGVIFGNGVAGWREDALYLPMPYGGNKVQEIIVGVPGREWAGTVINAP
jgi:hypothetical protein